MDASSNRARSLRMRLGTSALGLITMVLVLVAAASMPAAAQAVAVDPHAWQQHEENCGGANHERGSGQMDARGWLYLACARSGGADERGAINIYDAGGVLQRIVPLNGFPAVGTARNMASDVAPSPDGTYLYMFRYDTRTANRLVRQPDGSYAYDPTWALAAIPGQGVPRGMFLQTDATGALYVSSGLWAAGAPRTIAKYRADGSFITNFGTADNSWTPGVAYTDFTGLSVTADGRRVFVADLNNSRVHRFDRRTDDANSGYAINRVFGNTMANDPNRHGICNVAGGLAAPYDVAMTPGGELMVISVSCRYLNQVRNADGQWVWTGLADRLGVPVGTIEVQRFAQDGRALGMARGVSVNYSFAHGLAVDRVGAIHLPQARIVLRRPAGLADTGFEAGGGGPMGGTAAPITVGPPPVVPVADTTAPVLESVVTPMASTNAAISLAIAARDNVAVTGVRVTVDGAAFAWRPYATPLAHTLPGVGTHRLSVQVRDAAGNVSAVAVVTVTVTAPPTPAPTPTPTPTPTPRPQQPQPQPQPQQPQQPNAPTGNTDRTRPAVVKVVAPAQVTRGRVVRVRVIGRDNRRGALTVRFATERGTWGRWQSIRGPRSVILSPGHGWKGVFVQVRDSAGNRSRPWFQSMLAAPSPVSWKRGTAAADRVGGTRGADHIDASQYDLKADRISCGAGVDTVLLHVGDVAAADCERVVTLRTPGW